ncbi:MAG: hypothetical protein BroJett030_30070 [Alphaproteobacteria bacterium]|nr:MAG: hypothetical protein BroJett030_30070 [Alphaproteobacteria bacterium]
MATVATEDLSLALARRGLIARGGFDFAEGEERPAGPSGQRARAIILVGHAGGRLWPHFRDWHQRRGEAGGNPLDEWSREVIGAVAATFGAATVFPFDRPYWPFQQWARRAEGLRPSPLGMLIHPEYGLWHAWRGALLFDEAIMIAPPGAGPHPCDACRDRPCLTACPAAAFSESSHDVGACRSHLDSGAEPDCRALGCRARDACPAGRQWRYGAEQLRFHMKAFAVG